MVMEQKILPPPFFPQRKDSSVHKSSAAICTSGRQAMQARSRGFFPFFRVGVDEVVSPLKLSLSFIPRQVEGAQSPEKRIETCCVTLGATFLPLEVKSLLPSLATDWIDPNRQAPLGLFAFMWHAHMCA